MAHGRHEFSRHLVRIVVIYLVAAAVLAISMAAQLGPPHAGWGPLVVGVALLFWAMPPMAVYQLIRGDYDSHIPTSVLWFEIALLITACVVYRRELLASARLGKTQTLGGDERSA